MFNLDKLAKLAGKEADSLAFLLFSFFFAYAASGCIELMDKIILYFLGLSSFLLAGIKYLKNIKFLPLFPCKLRCMNDSTHFICERDKGYFIGSVIISSFVSYAGYFQKLDIFENLFFLVFCISLTFLQGTVRRRFGYEDSTLNKILTFIIGAITGCAVIFALNIIHFMKHLQ